MDEELSKKMREILGAEWCVDFEAACAWDCCGNDGCERRVKPSPAVAYALAERLNADSVYSLMLSDGCWSASAGAKSLARLYDGHVRFGRGDTRAEAECRALVALWEVMNRQQP